MKLIHKFYLSYYATLIKDCLSDELREKLIKKLEYHEAKLSA